MELTEEQRAEWEENGCLLLTDVLDEETIDSLDGWCNEVAGWEHPPEGVPGLYTLHYEAVRGARVVCRVENYTPFHKGLSTLAHETLRPLVSQLLGSEAVLYKEKVNLKHPGGKGYAPHYDGPSAASLGLATTFITVQVAVDTQTVENGCLEVVKPRASCPPVSLLPPVHGGDPDGNARVGALPPATVALCTWQPVEAPRGSVFLFHGLLPHKSGPNTSDYPRRTLYMLYNPLSEGDVHEVYYTAMDAARGAYKARKPAGGEGGGRQDVGSQSVEGSG